MESTLIVTIHIYTEKLKEWELTALENNKRVLSGREICFLIPHELDTGFLQEKYPDAHMLEVTTDWLGTKRGIKGYNEMMMSPDFYSLFNGYDYMVVCHLDAWIFRDELSEWCAKGYDLVAAPWPMRPRYRHFPLREYMRMKNNILEKAGKTPRALMYGQIGNGGLCLRRVEAFRSACERHAPDIACYSSFNDGMHNEDIFFALETPEISRPDVAEALRFSFDLKPHVCYRLNHNKLPMGCHGFMHSSRRDFWKNFIPCAK